MMPCANKVFALNRWSFLFGLLSAAGVSIVANFQELQLFTVHMIGASVAFGFGLVYCAIQTHLSYYMYPIVQSGLTLARCRLFLTIVLAVSYVTSSVFGPMAYANFKGSDQTKWKPSDGGYLYHVISSVCEWISALSIDFFILSFAHEFKFMSISSPKFYMISTVAVRPLEESASEDSAYGVINVVNSDSFASPSRASGDPQETPDERSKG